MFEEIIKIINNNNHFRKSNQVLDYNDYDEAAEDKILTGVSNNWTWNDHRWWKNEFLDYMNSLKIKSGDRPGDYKTDDKSYIDMPGFTPWTFLEKRQLFFGFRFLF